MTGGPSVKKEKTAILGKEKTGKQSKKAKEPKARAQGASRWHTTILGNCSTKPEPPPGHALAYAKLPPPPPPPRAAALAAMLHVHAFAHHGALAPHARTC